jgi:hypothetical protein
MKSSSGSISVVTSIALLFGCAQSAPPALGPDPIRVERDAPPAGARALGQLKAVDGKGCGVFGTQGSYEGAVARLREQARTLGADYLQVTDVKVPPPNHECLEKEYTVTAVAYRVQAEASPASSAAAVAAVATAAPSGHAAEQGAPNHGLLLGANGCSFRDATPGSSRTLSFSARVPSGTRLVVWIDRKSASVAEGVELAYDAAARHVELLSLPENLAVAVSPELTLGDGWHEWRIQRAPDRISVWLDERLTLLYAASEGSGDHAFSLEGAHVELRGIVTSAGD